MLLSVEEIWDFRLESVGLWEGKSPRPSWFVVFQFHFDGQTIVEADVGKRGEVRRKKLEIDQNRVLAHFMGRGLNQIFRVTSKEV